MKIYLAGPEVFLPQAPLLFTKKLEICRKHGCRGITPFDNNVALDGHPKRVAAGIIFTQNLAFIDQADAIIANITPFRGMHMDPGTAVEIGYAYALGKQISCYTQDSRMLLNRAQDPKHFSDPLQAHALRLHDDFGMSVEDFDMPENLMISSSVQSQGREVVVKDVPHQDRFASLEGFEEALLALF